MGSIALVSALSLTYILDEYKNNSNKNLQDELKDKVLS